MMLRRLRLFLLYFEGVTTVISGLVAFSSPVMMMSVLTAQEAGPAAEDVARMLGVGWVVIGLVVCMLPKLRDPRHLRLMILPVLVGDLLHMAATWPWDSVAALMHVVPTVIYTLNRGSIALRPEGFLSPGKVL